jgi:hypothetical protein
MKVTTWVEFSQEVDIDIGHEAIVAAFSACPDPGETWFPVLNRFAFALKALPDATIATWTAGQRKTIGDFLATQATRFSELPPSKIGWLGTSGTDMEAHDY